MKPTTGAAAAVGLTAPERLPISETQTPAVGAGAAGSEGVGEGDIADSAEAAAVRKRLVTLQALLALRGIELQELASGALQAVAPGLLVRFTELAAAEAWSRGRGGVHMTFGFQRDLVPGWREYADAAGLELQGHGIWQTTRCGVHDGSDSLRVNVAAGGWICMACGAKGGDTLAHRMAVTGEDFAVAARALG